MRAVLNLDQASRYPSRGTEMSDIVERLRARADDIDIRDADGWFYSTLANVIKVQIVDEMREAADEIERLQVERAQDAKDAAHAIWMNVWRGTDAAAWKLIRRIAARAPTIEEPTSETAA